MNQETNMFTQESKTKLIDAIEDSGMITMCADNLIVLAQKENCDTVLSTTVAYEMEASTGYDHQWDQEDIIVLLNNQQ